MMSFALMGCLIIGASDASAQGRSRTNGGSAASRSQSAAVSSPNKSTAPTVSRASSSSSNVSRSSSTPQVNRSSNTGSMNRSSNTTTTSRRSEATPQVNRGNSSGSDSSGASRPGSGASTRGGSGSISGHGGSSGNGSSTSGTGSVTRRSDSGVKHVTPSAGNLSRDNGASDTRVGISGNDRIGKPGGSKPNGGSKSSGDKPGGGSKPSGDKPGGGSKPNGGHKPGDGGHMGFGPDRHFDYRDHHYRDEFRHNFSRHIWDRPLPPPARPYYLAPWAWYRPMIPTGWRPYVGAPAIDRILGLTFGSLFEASLDHLYYSGYYIDGYTDGVIYLRDVPMLNLYWPDVMLNYDYNRLVNAQFVYRSSYYDTSRYNRVYRSLSRIYGPPVYRDGMTISWYGGNSKGYVTLSLVNDHGGYYTTMSIGY